MTQPLIPNPSIFPEGPAPEVFHAFRASKRMIEGSATRDFTYEFPLDSKTTEEIETILLEVETYTARVLVEKVRLDRIIDTLGGLRSRVDSTLCKRHRSDVYARNGISEEVSMIAMGRTRFEGLSRVDEVG